MTADHGIVEKIEKAKTDIVEADNFIREYMPFIKSEVASFINRAPQEGVDDELSIGMIAFHEAIEKYDIEKGNFLSFASMLIRNRLIDFTRKEKRHRGNISLYEEVGEDGEIIDIIEGEESHEEDIVYRDATKAEIAELSRQMENFGVSFMDVAENSPKQDRTLEACREVIRYAYENKELMEKFLKSKKLPITELEKGSKVSKKTIERHRKYLVVMLLIYSNGYEIIRGHIKQVLKGGTIK